MGKISHFEVKSLRVSIEKTRRSSPYGTFFSLVVGECLSNCPNFKKTPPPRKIPGYLPVSTCRLNFFFALCYVFSDWSVRNKVLI